MSERQPTASADSGGKTAIYGLLQTQEPETSVEAGARLAAMQEAAAAENREQLGGGNESEGDEKTSSIKWIPPTTGRLSSEPGVSGTDQKATPVGAAASSAEHFIIVTHPDAGADHATVALEVPTGPAAGEGRAYATVGVLIPGTVHSSDIWGKVKQDDASGQFPSDVSQSAISLTSDERVPTYPSYGSMTVDESMIADVPQFFLTNNRKRLLLALLACVTLFSPRIAKELGCNVPDLEELPEKILGGSSTEGAEGESNQGPEATGDEQSNGL